MAAKFVHSNEIRSRFSAELSEMYQQEVPKYGQLLTLVAEINKEVLSHKPELKQALKDADSLERIDQERHGAIRLGTARELATMRRAFAVLGMEPVGYYDLSQAGLPVHSTAFRPTDTAALNANPFRVFTSLLRTELISNQKLRETSEKALEQRSIFTSDAIGLIDIFETNHGLTETETSDFVNQLLETFRWHQQALVDEATYETLHQSHRLLADIVCFKGPHINHLTPRTLDIEKVQAMMPEKGIEPKDTIEGPPKRNCPILLRQTSFKALDEPIQFRRDSGEVVDGQHTARFGEVEQRGVALTPKGRKLYDSLLHQVNSDSKAHQSAESYNTILQTTFEQFPDSWEELRVNNLAYFQQINDENGETKFEPITYEDFLPVSAAGIFNSNLDSQKNQGQKETGSSNSGFDQFEKALGVKVSNPFDCYEKIRQTSQDVS